MKNLFKKTRLKIVALVMLVIVFGYSIASAAYPVSIINWPLLIQLLQQQVVQQIVGTIQNIWDKELAIKKLPGNASNNAVTVFNKDYSQYSTNLVTNEFNKKHSAFSDANNLKNSNSSLNNRVKATDEIKVPTDAVARTNPETYKSMSNEVLPLLIGYTHPVSKEAPPVDRYLKHMEDVDKKHKILAYDRGTTSVVIAEQFKNEIKQKFSPSTIDSSMPEQAVKDLAKLMYYNALLQAEILKTLGVAEQRNAITN